MSTCCNFTSFTSDRAAEEDDCLPSRCEGDISISKSDESGFRNVRSRTKIFPVKEAPNIEHEVNVAKAILQQSSSVTGDNLFDHLAELIKRIVKGSPENISDYLEEFSFNLRKQKFRIPERFPWNYYRPPDTSKVIHFDGKPLATPDDEYDVCKEERKRNAKESGMAQSFTDLSPPQRLLLFDENVLRLHLYWALCGLGFLPDEVLHLACSLQKLHYQPNVEHARFWGKIYGLRKSYYIVEAILTKPEMELRLEQMREEMAQMISVFRKGSEEETNINVDLDLTPGITWQDSPYELVSKMEPAAAPIPKPKKPIKFDIPPEAIGTGLNRRSYFVVTSLNDDWYELPIVTPKQMQVSRSIKKFLTGDLEADVNSFPKFPGVEKHYLRTLIARITSGTYVAPIGFYRKLTKKERMELFGEVFDEVITEDEGEEEEEDTNNDVPIIQDYTYKPLADKLSSVKSWVHVRPSVLPQGRVVYFDEEGARRALEREALLREKGEEEVFDEDEGEEEREIEETDKEGPEVGPRLFSQCHQDDNDEIVFAWTPKKSSEFNKINLLYTLRSNIWPGALAFTFDKYADNIYLGWGMKYVARNVKIEQLPVVQNDYYPDLYWEALDPTPEMEEAWRCWKLGKKGMGEEIMEEEFEEEDDIC